jgi:hypothetical protein
MAILAFAPGCRTLNLASPNRLDRPGAEQRRLSPAATQIVEKWSDNAAKVRSLKAEPTVKLTSVDGRKRFNAGVSGRLALERPRNFKLDLSTSFGQIADIGSNDELIWFWIKDGTEGVYLARYTPDGQPSAPLNVDPQWVMEAMGLQVISPEQIAKLDIRRDPATRHMIFSERRLGPAGERWLKETEMDVAGDIVAHRLLEDVSPKKLIASAEIEGWQSVAIPAEEGSAVPMPGSSRNEPAGDRVMLPEKIKLFWALDQLTIEVRLHKPQVNQPFNDDFRLAQFRPQEKRGQKFIDISDPRLLAARPTRTNPDAAGATPSMNSGLEPPPNPERLPDPAPLARLKEPEPLNAPEIPKVLPGDPTPEGVAPKRVGPVNPSLNVAPSSASSARGDSGPITRRSFPRPR